MLVLKKQYPGGLRELTVFTTRKTLSANTVNNLAKSAQWVKGKNNNCPIKLCFLFLKVNLKKGSTFSI